MKTKIIIIFFIFILVIVSFFFHQREHSTQIALKSNPESIHSYVVKQPQSHLPEAKKKANVNRLTASKNQAKKFMENVDASTFEFEYSFSNDSHLVSNIMAVPKKNYEVSMGDILHQDLRYNYINSELDLSIGKPSVYNSKNKKIAPLSHIIKLSGIDQEKRNEILALNFRENLYFQDLRLLFIETNTSDYLQVYQALQTAGYQPQHQVLSNFFEAK